MRYSVGAAARAAGITEGRLRTWERRYGIPSPGRTDSGRRVYDAADLEAIRRMVALVDRGVPAALAAEAVQSGSVPAEDSRLPSTPPPSHPAIEELVGHARRFDDAAARRSVRGLVRTLGWSDSWAHVLFPALSWMGAGWERGDLSSAPEHFLSELLHSEMAAVAAAAPPPSPDAPLVLLACAEGELHTLGLAALWLGLQQAGLRTCYLGANLPTESLVLATRDTAASAVCITATVQTSRPTLGQASRALARLRPAPRVFVGGPVVESGAALAQFAGTPLPPSVVEAVEVITSAVERRGR